MLSNSMGRLMGSLALAAAFHGPMLRADDWPQWMGPSRDNVWHETGVLETFTGDELPAVWRQSIAGGYAGVAVADGRVYVADYVTADNVRVDNFQRKSFTGTERVLCLNADTGEILWKHEYPVKYSISYPAGPRCTPLVDEDRVTTMGAEGHLICFEASTGKVLWQKHIPTDYQTATAMWGYAGHPLVDGEKLICVAGGAKSHAVAFNKRTGKELWRALTAAEQGYSPPTIVTHQGKRQLILLRPDAVGAVDPESGAELWSVPYQATSGSIIMSPLLIRDYLYAGGYSNKSILLKLNAAGDDVEEVWADAEGAISPVNVQPIADGDVIYGFDQGGLLCALEIPSGKRLWETPAPLGERALGSGTAFLVRQGDRYWMFAESGHLILAKLTREGYQELARTKVMEPTNFAFGRKVVWSAPAFANRHVYLRNDEECACFDLSAK
ncbi:MAG TPA: PQQ-binding-like beta-propeller repeat protein [Pirellulaceae bacterium]